MWQQSAQSSEEVHHTANNLIVRKKGFIPLPSAPWPPIPAVSSFAVFDLKNPVLHRAPKGVQIAQESWGSLLGCQPGPAVVSFVEV